MRKWYNKFDSFMVSKIFTISEYDHYVYFKSLENGMFIILVLYFDYIIIAIKSMVDINRLKAYLARTFDMKDLGVVKLILAMEIHEYR